MTKSKGIRRYSPKHSRPQLQPYLVTKQGQNGKLKHVWVIRIGSREFGYAKYLVEQSGIDLSGRAVLYKKSYNIKNVPTISDIEIVTRSENLKRNSIHKLPKEIQEAIRSIIILTKRINYEPRNHTAYSKKGSSESN